MNHYGQFSTDFLLKGSGYHSLPMFYQPYSNYLNMAPTYSPIDDGNYLDSLNLIRKEEKESIEPCETRVDSTFHQSQVKSDILHFCPICSRPMHSQSELNSHFEQELERYCRGKDQDSFTSTSSLSATNTPSMTPSFYTAADRSSPFLTPDSCSSSPSLSHSSVHCRNTCNCNRQQTLRAIRSNRSRRFGNELRHH